MVQQHVRGARRTHAEKRADDPRRRHRRLEHVSLEPLIEKVDCAHRHQLHLVVLIFVRQFLKTASEETQVLPALGIECRRIGRRHAHDRLHEVGHLDHGLAVLVVSFGVEARVARDLAARARVIVDAPEIVAVRHRRKRAVERKNLETVTRQIELANDLRSQQRDDVRANRKLEAGKDLFRNRRAAEYVATLQHQHLFPRTREIGGVYQTVMSAANHDDVVLCCS